MANAIILHRRRSEKIEPGSQTFSANGVFVAPYSTTYIVALTGSCHKAGNGGNGGRGRGYYSTETGVGCAGGGGGGGGGGKAQNYVVTADVPLVKGQSYSVTVNENMVSVANEISLATGTSAKDGGDARQSGVDIGDHRAGGTGGSGEGSHTISTSHTYTTSGRANGTSGERGDYGDYADDAESRVWYDGGTGGSGGTTGGGRGGDGGRCRYVIGDFDEESGESGSSGSARVIGSITISWGGNT